MRFIRDNRYFFIFLLLLVVCSVLVIRRFRAAEERHVELREALILLNSRGYTNEAPRIFQKLLLDLPRLTNRQLFDDFQRTLLLVDPAREHQENLIWKYHWIVSNELERRSESTLLRARKLANEK